MRFEFIARDCDPLEVLDYKPRPFGVKVVRDQKMGAKRKSARGIVALRANPRADALIAR